MGTSVRVWVLCVDSHGGTQADRWEIRPWVWDHASSWVRAKGLGTCWCLGDHAQAPNRASGEGTGGSLRFGSIKRWIDGATELQIYACGSTLQQSQGMLGLRSERRVALDTH
mmetsp:Transcript_18207/g.28258  ORF Transcript_18207/g.28258 Transcript_18207/m.28258 type:complete len:112 (+) Transcript_18207:295-630(+)